MTDVHMQTRFVRLPCDLYGTQSTLGNAHATLALSPTRENLPQLSEGNATEVLVDYLFAYSTQRLSPYGVFVE